MLSLPKMILLGLMAGAFIAFGGAASDVAMHGVADVGLARVVAGVIFPVGLMLVVFTGSELFTGNCLMIIPTLEKKIKVDSMLRNLVVVYISNFVGAMIIDLLNRILTPEQTTMVLLETMSGKGSEIGRSFEELAEIRAGVKLKEKVGVCLDTCHVFAAGYDLINDLDGVMTRFDKIIGLEHLKAVHLNDSMMPLGSNKDRHAKIGEGLIGKEALVRFVNYPALQNLPFILETPNDLSGYAQEIEFMREHFMG